MSDPEGWERPSNEMRDVIEYEAPCSCNRHPTPAAPQLGLNSGTCLQ